MLMLVKSLMRCAINTLGLYVSHTHTLLYSVHVFVLGVVDNGRIVSSVELAEEFHHFYTLIRLCDVQQDREALKTYFDQFKDYDFGDSLFQYYMNNGEMHHVCNTWLMFIVCVSVYKVTSSHCCHSLTCFLKNWRHFSSLTIICYGYIIYQHKSITKLAINSFLHQLRPSLCRLQTALLC